MTQGWACSVIYLSVWRVLKYPVLHLFKYSLCAGAISSMFSFLVVAFRDLCNIFLFSSAQIHSALTDYFIGSPSSFRVHSLHLSCSMSVHVSGPASSSATMANSYWSPATVEHSGYSMLSKGLCYIHFR